MMKGLGREQNTDPQRPKGLWPTRATSCQASLSTAFPEISVVQEGVGVCGRVSRELEANCIFFAMLGHF